MDSWSCLVPATFGKARMHRRRKGGVVSTGVGRDGDRSRPMLSGYRRARRALPDPDGVHRSPGVDVLSVCGCGGSRTRSAACQELAKTGANRVDRATQAGHADFADLGLRDAVEHLFTLSCSLGVKWSLVPWIPTSEPAGGIQAVDLKARAELQARSPAQFPRGLGTDLGTKRGATAAIQ